MSEELDCANDVNLALKHEKAGSYKFALTFLENFRGCHLTHETCVYKGEDCAVQDVIEGFIERDEAGPPLEEST